MPFGVDSTYFAPQPDAVVDTDVVSIGADPRRDHMLFLALARARPEWSYRLVLASDAACALGPVPRTSPSRWTSHSTAYASGSRARGLVVLPVRDNSYSGATTVLLQAMATARPVVVSRTAAIATGYHLEDGVNCRLVPPGSLDALEEAVGAVLSDDEAAASLAVRARETVERHLTWSRFTESISALLRAAARPGVTA